MVKLEDLKVGDKVIAADLLDYIYPIEKITPAGFIKAGGKLYDPKTGRARDGRWPAYIRPATPESLHPLIEVRERNNLLHELRNTSWQKLPIDILRCVWELVESYQKGE